MSLLVGALSTKEGRAALDMAVAEGVRRGLDVTLVHATGVHRETTPDEAQAWERALSDAGERLAAAGRSLHRQDVATDDSAQALLDTAEQVGADFIVIGLRRRTPVGKLLLGSHAQRVLLEAGCPVIAVKAPDEA